MINLLASQNYTIYQNESGFVFECQDENFGKIVFTFTHLNGYQFFILNKNLGSNELIDLYNFNGDIIVDFIIMHFDDKALSMLNELFSKHDLLDMYEIIFNSITDDLVTL